MDGLLPAPQPLRLDCTLKGAAIHPEGKCGESQPLTEGTLAWMGQAGLDCGHL